MPVPRLFDIRRRRREHRRVDDHVRERDLAEQEEPGEDHPVLPEADDLARGRVDVARVVPLELGRPLGPAERRERPERRREPRVEHVGIALELGRPALGAGVGRRPGARQVTVGARPDRDLMPHQSWRETHQSGALERLDREPVLARGGTGRAAREAPRSPGARARPSGTTTAARRAARSGSGSARTFRRSDGTAPAPRAGPAPRARRRSACPRPSGRGPRSPRRSSGRPGR